MNEDNKLSFVIKNIQDVNNILNKRTQFGIVLKEGYNLLRGINLSYFAKLIDESTDLINVYMFDSLANSILARKQGITKKIILLYYIEPIQVQLAIDNDIEITCPNIEWLNMIISKIDTSKNKLKLHIYFDSNLGREGLNDSLKLYELLREINKHSNIELVGLGTKFNSKNNITSVPISKNLDISLRKKFLIQEINNDVENFNNLIKYCKDNNLINQNTKIHAACSSEVFSDYSETYYDFVRLGTLIFTTVLNDFHSKYMILDIKKIQINNCIGYFCEEKTHSDITVAYIEYPKIKNCLYKLNNIIVNPVVKYRTYNPFLLDITGFSNVKIGDFIDVHSNNVFF